MSAGGVSRETPPDVAREVFGDRLDLAEAYARWLGSAGIERGLLGPREIPRLWERHILNCAVVAPGLPPGARVADVGSGAGLPGVVWAIARPDLEVVLIEPTLRRTTFLAEVVEDLGLDSRVIIWRGRAQDHQEHYRVVTARAVGPLKDLATWSLPLVESGGTLLALKGSRAHEELEGSSSTIERLGATSSLVKTYGEDILRTPTTVIEVQKA